MPHATHILKTKTMKTINLFGLLIMLVVSASCTKEHELPPDPASIAQSNFNRQFTLSNGTKIPLADSYCDSQTFKAGNGFEYVECRAKVQGYVHYETYYCATKEGMSCESSRPE